MRRPTRAAAAVVGCGAALILLSGPAQAAWLTVLGALVLGVPVGSLGVRHRLDGAVVDLRAPERARVGDPVEVRLRVRAPDHALPLHRVDLVGAPYGSASVLVEPVPLGRAAECAVPVVPTTRGVFSSQPLVLRSGAPFGLLRSDRATAAVVRTEIAAPVVALPVDVLRSVTGDSDAAAQRRRGGGDEVHAVREYRSGDALRDVHWRSTARAGRLVVREYERAVPTRAAVAVVGGTAGEAFETLVAAATSVAQAIAWSGEAVDVLHVVDGGSVTAVRGASQHGLHAWSAALTPRAGDAADVAREVLSGDRPSAVVLAVAPGAARIAAACTMLTTAGSAVTVISTGPVEALPAAVRWVRISPGGDLATDLVAALTTPGSAA